MSAPTSYDRWQLVAVVLIALVLALTAGGFALQLLWCATPATFQGSQ